MPISCLVGCHQWWLDFSGHTSMWRCRNCPAEAVARWSP